VDPTWNWESACNIHCADGYWPSYDGVAVARSCDVPGQNYTFQQLNVDFTCTGA
jgi:hypothetical protein